MNRHLYFLVAIFLKILPVIFCSEDFVCSLNNYDTKNTSKNDHDVWFNGTTVVTYERNKVAVYEYSNLQYINILLDEVKLNFEGTYYFKKDLKSDISLTISTSAEGIALFKKPQNKTGGTEVHSCEFNFTKNALYSDELPAGLQGKLINAVNECLQEKLCAGISKIEQDDYARAKAKPYNFKYNSVPYRNYTEKFYNLAAAYADTQGVKTDAKVTLNFISDVLASSAISQVSKKEFGKLEFPDIMEPIDGFLFLNGYYHLFNGTVRDLSAITRAQNTIFTSEGLEFSVEVAYKIPKPRIHFDTIDFKFTPVHVTGSLDINIDDIYFKINILLNYNKMPCQVEVSTVHLEIGKIELQLSEDITLSSLLNAALNQLIDLLHDRITKFAIKKTKEPIETVLNKFNCENFRP